MIKYHGRCLQADRRNVKMNGSTTMAATKMMNRIDMARMCDAEKPTCSRHRVLYYIIFVIIGTDVILCAPRRLYLRAYYNNSIIVIRSRYRSNARVWWFFFAVPSQKGCFDSLFHRGRETGLYLPTPIGHPD